MSAAPAPAAPLTRVPSARASEGAVVCPLSLTVEPIARFMNCEIADDPVYTGLELQAFDDEIHGTGLLAFLQRRDDGRVDYYLEPGLRLDPVTFSIGAGIGRWVEQPFEAARLDVDERGIDAEVRFADAEGRTVEVRIDDREAGRARRARLLAPVGAGVEEPRSLLLVLLDGFDLVRRTARAPVVRIGGRDVSTGRLPGRRLHRRHLIKYAAPLTVVKVNPDGPAVPALVDPAAPGDVELVDGRVASIAATDPSGRRAVLRLDPPLPDLRTVAEARGRWTVDVGDARAVTGGTWAVARIGGDVAVFFDVTRRWRPDRRPLLMGIVTRVIPTFRHWPTTYRWTATVHLDPTPTMSASWQRTESGSGERYRRATGSA